MKTALAILLLVSASGCVERKLEVKTSPPDALVTVDGKQATRSEAKDPKPEPGAPAVLKFEHYGIRNVVVRAEGFRAQDRLVIVDPPWWQLFPMDFVTDILVPWTIEDVRTEEFTLVRRDDLDEDGRKALLQRALDAAAQAEKHP